MVTTRNGIDILQDMPDNIRSPRSETSGRATLSGCSIPATHQPLRFDPLEEPGLGEKIQRGRRLIRRLARPRYLV